MAFEDVFPTDEAADEGIENRTAHIAHEDFGGRPVPPQEAQEGSNEKPPEELV